MTTSTAEYARQVVADWPPLTAEELDRVAALLRTTLPGGDVHAHTK